MDIVYVCRDGENPELRYSMRTLQNVEHGDVFVFGGAPRWVNPDTVTYVKRRQNNTPAQSTRGHITAACKHDDVSDPFLLWNDDFYAMQPVPADLNYHRGLLVDHVERMKGYSSPWTQGLRAVQDVLEKMDLAEGAFSYSIHVPLVVHKEQMLEAIRVANDVKVRHFHLRTLYGVMAGIGGEEYVDPKMLRARDPFPEGPWLSSSKASFTRTVEPVLRYMFPDPSVYER